MVSLDAYHYFGTDDLYIGYVSRFVRPGGAIGIVVPGVLHELNGELVARKWPWDWCSFHSPNWWRQHWEKTGMLDVEVADTIPDGWQHWLKWLDVCMEEGYRSSQEEIDILRADAGSTLGFTRVVGRRR